MVVNGDEFENIELRRACEVNREGQIVSGGQPNRQPTPIPGSTENATPENLTTEVDSNDNSKTRDIIELSRELSKNLQNLALQGSQQQQQQQLQQQQQQLQQQQQQQQQGSTIKSTSEEASRVTNVSTPPGQVIMNTYFTFLLIKANILSNCILFGDRFITLVSII